MIALTPLANGDVRGKTAEYYGGLPESLTTTFSQADGTPGNRSWGYFYDSENRISTIALPNGEVYFNYSANGLEMNRTDQAGYTTSYFYNNRHQITGIAGGNAGARPPPSVK